MSSMQTHKTNSNLGDQTNQSDLALGSVGWWIDPFGQEKLGVLLASDTLQIYDRCCYGFMPTDNHDSTNKWPFKDEIYHYHYVERGSGIYLIIE